MNKETFGELLQNLYYFIPWISIPPLSLSLSLYFTILSPISLHSISFLFRSLSFSSTHFYIISLMCFHLQAISNCLLHILHPLVLFPTLIQSLAFISGPYSRPSNVQPEGILEYSVMYSHQNIPNFNDTLITTSALEILCFGKGVRSQSSFPLGILEYAKRCFAVHGGIHS